MIPLLIHIPNCTDYLVKNDTTDNLVKNDTTDKLVKNDYGNLTLVSVANFVPSWEDPYINPQQSGWEWTQEKQRWEWKSKQQLNTSKDPGSKVPQNQNMAGIYLDPFLLFIAIFSGFSLVNIIGFVLEMIYGL